MRVVLVVLASMSALFGIPLLVAQFRDSPGLDTRPVSAPPVVRPAPAATPVPLPPQPGAVSPGQPPSAQLVPVTLKPAQAAPARTPETPSGPAEGRELTFAIQNELIRLGYYRGRASGNWTKAARRAARQFIRETHSQAHHSLPSAGLLAALKATHPIAPPQPEAAAVTHPAAQPVRSASLAPKDNHVKEATAAPPPAAQSSDYLPPWMIGDRGRGSTADRPDAEQVAPGNEGPAAAARGPAGAAEPGHEHRNARRHPKLAHRAQHWRRAGFFFPF